jgi:tRNA pseudouridine55 synthase
LPICFGEATKFSQFLLESDKRYWVEAKLGVRTTTSDAEGEIVSERTVPTLTTKKIDKAMERYRGEIDQVPSMYSALKHQGQPLYKLARQGITVERPARRLTIYEYKILAYAGDCLTLEVHCSKGTYVRTLVDDLGEVLGCGAHVTGLRRLDVGPYKGSGMITLEQLQQTADAQDWPALQPHLLPLDTSVTHWPEIQVSADMAFYMHQGQAIWVPHAPTSGWVRLYQKSGDFLGVGEIQDDGKIAPRRLIKK